MDFFTFVVVAMTCGILLSVLLILFSPVIEIAACMSAFFVSIAKAIRGENKPKAL